MANKIILIPKRADWKKLKTACGVPDGAAKGINLGDQLDKFHKAYDAAKTAPDRIKALQPLALQLADYIKKVDRKSVKEWSKFEKQFLDNYAGAVHEQIEDLKRYNADAEVYGKELVKLFAMSTKLKKTGATLAEIQAFKSGPLRGTSAVGRNAKGLDTSKIDAVLGPVNAVIDKLPAAPKQDMLDAVVRHVHLAVEKVAELAKAQKLV
ncbi:MAG TPA: hypothetical protein VF291_12475 [Burkholderiaceae bacterium]|jgi:hypothetical protein